MTQIDDLGAAVELMAGQWPLLSGSGDSNPADVLWLARGLEATFAVRLPTSFPPKLTGVGIFEDVEAHLINDYPTNWVLRHMQPRQVGDRVRNLVRANRSNGRLNFTDPENLVVALFTWHGCISMAKSLRPDHRAHTSTGLAPYTLEMRWAEYNLIRECWTGEEARGNLWVRYGVSIARLMEQRRKKDEFASKVIENWVPQDSPYWEA